MNMEFSLPLLQRQKLMVCVPMYGGQCMGTFAKAMIDLKAMCMANGIQVVEYFLFNESLITRARNYCCEAFMTSDCTHLMFIDADIGFSPQDVIALMGLSSQLSEITDPTILTRLEAGEKISGYVLDKVPGQWFHVANGQRQVVNDPNALANNAASLQNNPNFEYVPPSQKWMKESDFDIIGGPYPKKTISWEKVLAAVNKGKGDQDPNQLQRYVGDYVFNPKANTTEFKIGEPVEVLEIGTGFMMIRRSTLEKFAEAYPQYMYRPDHIRTAEFDGSKLIMQFFQAEIDPGSLRYLSEDYWFTQRAQQIGLKTWLCPWMSMTHSGMYIFGGSLIDLASIGASATADPAALKKKQTTT